MCVGGGWGRKTWVSIFTGKWIMFSATESMVWEGSSPPKIISPARYEFKTQRLSIVKPNQGAKGWHPIA